MSLLFLFVPDLIGQRRTATFLRTILYCIIHIFYCSYYYFIIGGYNNMVWIVRVDLFDTDVFVFTESEKSKHVSC